MQKKKALIDIQKVKSKRAKFFLLHAKQQATLKKYNSSIPFISKFKHAFFKTQQRTFLIDLKRGFAPTPISIALTTNIGKQKHVEEIIYEARIRFRGNSIIIESVQGSKFLTEIRDFEKHTGLPASRFLIKEIIAQAKTNGYNQILLKRPEHHPSYKNPAWINALDKLGKKLWEKTAFDEATPQEKKEFEEHKNEAIMIIQARMKKIYKTIAIAEGMKKRGQYFVKNI